MMRTITMTTLTLVPARSHRAAAAASEYGGAGYGGLTGREQ